MSVVNGIFNTVLGGFLSALSGMPAWVGLLVVSVVVGIGALFVYKVASNQRAITRVKDQIQAGIYEIRLFNDDVGAVLRAQSEILWHNLKYLGLNLAPVAVMIIPVVLIAAQLQAHYGYEGLKPGQSGLVTVKLDDDWQQKLPEHQGKPDVSLSAPDGVSVDTAPVWVASQHELTWRVTVEEPGDYELAVHAGGQDYTKQLSASQAAIRRSPVRQVPNFFGQLLYPAEATLPADGPLAAITVHYDDAEVSIAGLRLHWIVWFMILTIVAAFALRDRMGVTF
jgi:uncharacterized membrane protein (DUF106 family)